METLKAVPDPKLQSSFEHCRDIVLAADRLGFDNVLLPSGYDLGIDNVAFAGGMAPMLEQINMLLAVRTGEMWLPQLVRQLATLDQMLDGRLTVNWISSDPPGVKMESEPRYRRTTEAMKIVRALMSGESVDFHGEFFDITLDPPSAVRKAGAVCPPFYFGGLSEAARQCAAEGADVYLMWPEPVAAAAELVEDMTRRAAAFGRTLKFGFRVHMIVRETEAEARAAAERLVSKLDDDEGRKIRERSLDAASAGVARQAALREGSDDGYVEDNLWTGIGRARSGCGAAIVGDPDQVLAKIEAYRAVGIDAFIFSGYPHRDEAELFGKYVLPKLDHARFHSHPVPRV
ncbi:MAG: LLM class flavin-dependent oxidoreductase [Acidimicrobiales bacterium]